MSDRILAIVVLFVASLYLYATFSLPELEVEDPVGPRVFPAMIGVTAIVAAVLLLVQTSPLLRGDHGETVLPTPRIRSRPVAVFAVLGWMLGFYLLLEPVGYLLTSSAFLFGLMAYFNRGRWVTNGVVTVGFTLGVYVVFTQFLGIQLPWGVLYF